MYQKKDFVIEQKGKLMTDPIERQTVIDMLSLGK